MSSYHWEAQRKQKVLDKRYLPVESSCGRSKVSSVQEGGSAQSSRASSSCSSGGSSVMTGSAVSTPPPSPTPPETKKDALPEELQRRLGMLVKREAQQPMSKMARSNLLKEADGFHRAIARRSAKLPGRYTSLDYAQQW